MEKDLCKHNIWAQFTKIYNRGVSFNIQIQIERSTFEWYDESIRRRAANNLPILHNLSLAGKFSPKLDSPSVKNFDELPAVWGARGKKRKRWLKGASARYIFGIDDATRWRRHIFALDFLDPAQCVLPGLAYCRTTGEFSFIGKSLRQPITQLHIARCISKILQVQKLKF